MVRIILCCLLLVPAALYAQTKKIVVPTQNQVTSAKKPPASPSKNTVLVSVERGKLVYQTYCLACHQADGGGVQNLNPPLVKQWVSGDKSKLIRLLLKGSIGKVVIDGDYFSNTMPAQANFTDQQIADVLTFMRNNFGFKASIVTPAEVKAVRAKTK